MTISFTKTGWGDYVYWEAQDKKTLRQINRLIADIGRGGHSKSPPAKPPSPA